MGFSRQEYWSGLPFLSPGDLPKSGIEPVFPVSWIGRRILYHLSHQGRLQLVFTKYLFCSKSGTNDDLFLVPTFKRASQVAQWVKNPPANAGGTGDLILILGLERSPGGGYGNPLQYSCLENPMNRGVWWATVQRATKIQTRLKQLSMHAHTFKELPFL